MIHPLLCIAKSNFYPRSPCGERPGAGVGLYLVTGISIHALLAESDAFDVLAVSALLISIHALLAESDYQDKVSFPPAKKFLSTLSLRRATHFIKTDVSYNIFLSTLSLRRATTHPVTILVGVIENFYPRSPCGERRWMHHARPIANNISIHALLAESDRELV